ncbi:MAG: SAM-dependent methyltransferase, partial [Sphingomonas sp.]
AEGERQVETLLAARPDYAIAPPDASLLPAGVPVAAQGWVRTLPGMIADEGGCDGFFIARLTRS